MGGNRIQLGRRPGDLDGVLRFGEDNALALTFLDAAGVEAAWPATPVLEFATSPARDTPVTFAPVASLTNAGKTAQWVVPASEIVGLRGRGTCWARLRLNGETIAAGSVRVVSRWADGGPTSGLSVVGVVTGPPGPGGGGSDPTTVDAMDPAFGVVGDGIADDTAALQAAIDACPEGGTLLIPDGTYLIDGDPADGTDASLLIAKGLMQAAKFSKGGLRPKKSQTFKLADNAVLKLKPTLSRYATVIACVDGAKGVTILGGEIDGDSTTHTPYTAEEIELPDWAAGRTACTEPIFGAGVLVGPGCDDVTVRAVKFKHHTGAGVAVVQEFKVTYSVEDGMSQTYGVAPKRALVDACEITDGWLCGVHAGAAVNIRDAKISGMDNPHLEILRSKIMALQGDDYTEDGLQEVLLGSFFWATGVVVASFYGIDMNTLTPFPDVSTQVLEVFGGNIQGIATGVETFPFFKVDNVKLAQASTFIGSGGISNVQAWEKPPADPTKVLTPQGLQVDRDSVEGEQVVGVALLYVSADTVASVGFPTGIHARSGCTATGISADRNKVGVAVDGGTLTGFSLWSDRLLGSVGVKARAGLVKDGDLHGYDTGLEIMGAVGISGLNFKTCRTALVFTQEPKYVRDIGVVLSDKSHQTDPETQFGGSKCVAESAAGQGVRIDGLKVTGSSLAEYLFKGWGISLSRFNIETGRASLPAGADPIDYPFRSPFLLDPSARLRLSEGSCCVNGGNGVELRALVGGINETDPIWAADVTNVKFVAGDGLGEGFLFNPEAGDLAEVTVANSIFAGANGGTIVPAPETPQAPNPATEWAATFRSHNNLIY